MQILEFDTVIIGSGLAGLSAAYYSAQHGSVAIVTKSQFDTSNSYYAQGGIAAAITEADSPELHLHDTVVAGRGLCDIDAVKILVEEGRDRVLEMIEMGMQFDKADGEFTLGLEGGHSKRRILHAGGDATGKELTCFWLQKVKEVENISAFEYVAAVKLLADNQCINGVQAIDFKTNQNIIFKSKAVIIATGGLSRVYARSTNPHTATGDGVAMAYNAGAKIADIEFIQFHPSALYLPDKDPYLISEAVRGEGAHLLNVKGERYMKDIHPLAELAPRDIVAYSTYRQIQKYNSNIVYLTLKHLDKQKVIKRFGNIYNKLKEFGFDLTTDNLPISPAAHYMVGGIRTGLDAQTNINGLFVCGEAASTGVMGANRLASNSLLECLVFGKRASDKAAQLKSGECNLSKVEPVTNETSNEQFFLKINNEVASIMEKYVGIVRNQVGLEKALGRLNELGGAIPDNPKEYNLIKAKNILDIAHLVCTAALTREESRGGHIREDFQKENPDLRVHIVQQKNKKIQYETVRK